MKLSKRLTEIHKMVNNDYDHIWDCCCDHGFLGINLLTSHPCSTVHFVDIVPELITQLESQLTSQYKSKFESQHTYVRKQLPYETHCIDVAQLPLQAYKGKQLVIISGVGGDLMSSFIETLIKKHQHLTIDFLLCPVHHLYTLRSTLINLQCSMHHEKLVEDNKRFYEILYISTQKNRNNPISVTGKDIWLAENDEQATTAKRYLQQTLGHYQRVAKSNKKNVQKIIKAYQAITL